MWCNQCQQDVPGTAAAEEGEFCCPRCGGSLNQGADPATRSAVAADDQSQAFSPSATSPPLYDGWELDQQLRHMEQVIGARKQDRGDSEAAYRQEVSRLDPSHGGPSAWHFPPAGKPSRAARPRPTRSHSAAATVIWAALSLGTMTFVCGLILLGWSLVGQGPPPAA